MTVMVAAPTASAGRAAAVASTAAAPPVRVRPFEGARRDAEAIARICRDVYEGTDYVPRVIGHLGSRSEGRGHKHEERTIVLVADEAGDEETAAAAAAGPEGGGGSEEQRRRQAQTPTQRQPSRQVGVVVAQLRGDGHAFLFGLRVDPSARGRGVGGVLMRAAVEAAEAAGASHLVGATVPSNAASIALFAATGHAEVARVDVWPPFPLLTAYERAVGFRPAPGRAPAGEPAATYGGQGGGGVAGEGEGEGASPSLRMLDHLAAGAVRRVLLGAATAAAGAAPAGLEPERCACVVALSEALAGVRRAQRGGRRDGALTGEAEGAEEEGGGEGAAAQASRGGGGGGGGGGTQWVPAMYEAMPARGPWARERVREGGAWLLPRAASPARPGPEQRRPQQQRQRQHEAVVVVGPSLEARRFVAGIVAADGDAAARALLLAEKLAPAGGHFIAFLDVPPPPPSASEGSGGGCALSELYGLTRVEETHPEGRGRMLVFHRAVGREE